MDRQLDICILVVEPTTEQRHRFSFYDFQNIDMVRERDSLVSWVHQSHLSYSYFKGTVSYLFERATLPQSHRFSVKYQSDIARNLHIAKVNFYIYYPFRTIAIILDKDDENLRDYNPELPLIECHGFHIKGGASGYPVFKSINGRLIGIFALSCAGRDYVIPWSVIEHFVNAKYRSFNNMLIIIKKNKKVVADTPKPPPQGGSPRFHPYSRRDKPNRPDVSSSACLTAMCKSKLGDFEDTNPVSVVKDTFHTFEKESGLCFNLKYLEDAVTNGEWEKAEKYLLCFTNVNDNEYSTKIYFEIRKHKYLEALDMHDCGKALEILRKDFPTFGDDTLTEMTLLLRLRNFREDHQLSKYGDTNTERSIMLAELKKLIKENPLFGQTSVSYEKSRPRDIAQPEAKYFSYMLP